MQIREWVRNGRTDIRKKTVCAPPGRGKSTDITSSSERNMRGEGEKTCKAGGGDVVQ